MNNGFGWNRLPKSFMSENTVFLLLTALIHNFYKTIISKLDTKACLLYTSEITAANRQFRLKGDVALQDWSHPQDAYVFGTLSELTATTRGVGFLVRNLSHDYNGCLLYTSASTTST